MSGNHRTGMDPLDFEDKHRARKASRPKDTETASLFDEPLQPKREPVPVVPSQRNSSTSKEAAEKVAPRARAMAKNVLDAITAAGSRGLTRRELEDVTHYLTQTLCARLKQLEDSNDIRKLTEFNESSREIDVIKRDGCAVYIRKERANAAA